MWLPRPEEHPGEGEHTWCPRCASGASARASQSYQSKGRKVESVMSEFWEAPTALAVPGNTVATTHRDCVLPMAPPPGMSSLTTEERLAALEEEVAELRRSVAKLVGHSSDAATG